MRGHNRDVIGDTVSFITLLSTGDTDLQTTRE